ncbi:polysaccharide biosynthesis protein [Desulfosarcina sp.]|uniref:polysaccharide biosynthesis protein n=1 Tax=Desulfosarcina sp. TaxID=2027861 RepID=UPI00356A9868
MLFEKLARSSAARRIARLIVPYRLVINIGIHTLLFMASYFYSIVLFNGLVLDKIVIEMFMVTFWPLLIIRLAVFYYNGLFSGMWRFVSFEDLIIIIRSVIISSLLVYGLSLVWDRICMGEAVYLLDMTFCIIFCGGIRLLVRNYREVYLAGDDPASRTRIILLGPVNRVQPILKDILGDPRSHYSVVAVVDPDEYSHSDGLRISDVPVMSIDRMLKLAKKIGDIDSMVICWPGSTRRQIDGVIERFQPLKITYKIIPHFEEIINEKVSVNSIRHVEIDDLLEREPVHIDMDGISDYIKGKGVMVTGGAGSIGSEICRQVAGFNPRLLFILDRSENSLYDFEREMTAAHPDLPIVSVISSVNDAAGLKRLMKAHRIEVVFHAAAYKHVPLMEKAPIESAYNTIIGTYNTVCAALEAGVRRFVMISTDKAVNPTNVMGVTKRIAEMIVQSSHRKHGTWFMTVRFGNVLGSAGSVVPIFKQQIKRGEPLTVTDPEIERFFMTIPEAVQLVLQAGCMAAGGEIFVLDMGQPVKIVKLAEKLITLSGMQPYEDIDIVFTGLRPGEKMYEELFNQAETLLPTSHPRIKSAQSQPVDKAFMDDQVKAIQAIIMQKDVEALYQAFMALVPGCSCRKPDDDAGEVAPGAFRVAVSPEGKPKKQIDLSDELVYPKGI